MFFMVGGLKNRIRGEKRHTEINLFPSTVIASYRFVNFSTCPGVTILLGLFNYIYYVLRNETIIYTFYLT